RATERIRAFAYPLGWRIAGALLFALSRASLPAILALVVLATDPPVTPPVLVRVVVVLALLPGLAARLVARALAAEVSVDGDALVIRRRDLRLEVPCRAIALLPTAVLFNAHQHITYGGVLGEYYLLGLGSYVRTFAVHWLTLTIYLVLYASVWRGLAEGTALLGACVAPARAAWVRRAAEIV